MSKWNKNKFSIYKSEEKSVLGLIKELGDQTNYNTDEVEKVKESNNKKVSYDDMVNIYKLDENANFEGSWHGIKKPTEFSEGLAGTVDQIYYEIIPDLKTQISELSASNIHYNKYKGTPSERFNKIFSEHTKGTILINEDINLTETLVLPSGFSLLSQNNSKIISGDFDGIQIKENENFPPSEVVSIEGNAITVSSVDTFEVGCLVHLYNEGFERYYGIVRNIDKELNKIYVTSIMFNIKASNLKLRRVEPNNNIIKGFTFTKTQKTSKKDIRINGVNVVIEDNKFLNCQGVTFEDCGYCKFTNNELNDVGDCCLIWDCCNIEIANNILINFEQGIRCIYPYMLDIVSNELYNGKSQQYSVGIELTGTTLEDDKVCYNKVRYNKVINVNVGVPGSANGGIHLNFNAHHNLIEGNTVLKCGIGIYLENYCMNNTISNNISSYNSGWYGVGIETDWNCHNNTIIGNTCEYNSGNIESNESCGIEVRCGTSSDEHIIYNTIVANNKCRYNGQTGIYISGYNTSCANNICENNGTDKGHSKTSDLMIIDCENSVIVNNVLHGGGSTSPLLVLDSNKIIIANNSVIGHPTDTHCLLIETSDNIDVNSNIFNSSSSQRRVYFLGTSSRKLKNIKCINNFIEGNDNGYSQLEFNNIDGYLNKYNTLLSNAKVVTWECVNEIN